MRKYISALLLSALALSLLSGCTVPTEGSVYKAGTYTASAQGYGGDIKVNLTVDEKSITNVTIEGPDETPGIGGEAIKTLPEVIKSANSDQFDGVSGATVTSDAVKKAVGEALAKAK